MKRLIVLLLAVALVVLIGCASKGSTESQIDVPVVSSDGEPSSTPSPPKSPEKLEDVVYESFFTYSGTGDDVVTGLVTEHFSMLKTTHLGSGHFAIKAHYEDTYDLLINTTDPYNGGYTLLFPNQEYTLEVNSDNEWSVEASRIGTSSSDVFSGYGDYVTPICVSTSNVYEIIADGGGHFAVKGYDDDGSYDLLVNTTKPYSGKVMFAGEGEICFFEIIGERDWTITPQ